MSKTKKTSADINGAKRASWQKKVSEELRDTPLESLTKSTAEGIDIAPLYTNEDVQGLPHMGSLPGEAPFVRGPRASMYTHRPWTIRQYAGFSTAEETNEFFRTALNAGQKGLSVAFDLATHRGYDSDHERVRGDVGLSLIHI